MSKMTLINHKDHQKDPTKAKMCQMQALFSNCLMRQNDSKLNVWLFSKWSMHMLDYEKIIQVYFESSYLVELKIPWL